MRVFLFLFLVLVLAPGNGWGGGSFFVSGESGGVIATVNGSPITLHLLEGLYDINEKGVLLASAPSVGLLQKQYVATLGTLIVHELIVQELGKRGLSVSDAQLEAEEALVRSNYPPGKFEEILGEAFLDLDIWRELVRQRLAVRLFREKVLRPRLTVSQQEIEAEYAASEDLINQPEKVKILWFEDVDRERLTSRRTSWINSKKAAGAPAVGAGKGEPSEADEQWNELEEEVLCVSTDRLPAFLRKDLAALKPGEATPIRHESGMYAFAVLQGRLPRRRLGFAEVYPFLEASLVERKEAAVYDAWLAEALSHADIRVAARLKPIPAGEPSPQTGEEPEAGESVIQKKVPEENS